jgi:Polyketide cyclase / dehydrase and lipid transport
VFEFECSEETAASRADVWALWSDPARWPEFDDGIVRAKLDGPFVAGAKVRLKPKGGPAAWLEIVTAEPNAGFSTLARLPLAQMRFAHSLSDAAGGRLRITSTIRVTGGLSWLFPRLFKLARNEVAMLQNLARLAERPLPDEAAA